GVDMRDAGRNILPLFLLAFRNLLSCHEFSSVVNRQSALLLRLLLAGNGLRFTLASSGVGSGALAARRQAAPMAQTPIGTDLDEAANIALTLTPQVALDLIVGIDHFAKLSDLGFAEILDLLRRIDPCLRDDIVSVMLADSVNQRNRIEHRFFSRKVNT